MHTRQPDLMTIEAGSSRLLERIRRDYSPEMRPSNHAFDSHHHHEHHHLTSRQEHDEDLNRLWLVVKHLKVGEVENRFELRGGEKIRIGRVIFTVKEIVNDKIQFKSDIGDSASRVSEADLVDMEDLNQTDDGLQESEEILREDFE